MRLNLHLSPQNTVIDLGNGGQGEGKTRPFYSCVFGSVPCSHRAEHVWVCAAAKRAWRDNSTSSWHTQRDDSEKVSGHLWRYINNVANNLWRHKRDRFVEDNQNRYTSRNTDHDENDNNNERTLVRLLFLRRTKMLSRKVRLMFGFLLLAGACPLGGCIVTTPSTTAPPSTTTTESTTTQPAPYAPPQTTTTTTTQQQTSP